MARETGGLIEDFERKAWQALTNDPSKPYVRIEPIMGVVSVRYAIADIL